MGIIYKNPEKRRFATVARILSIEDGKGKAFGIKSEVVLSYEFKGKERRDKVSFWDSKKNSNLRLHTKVSKCSPGDKILVLIANEGTTNTAIAFAVEQEFLDLEEKRFFLGKAKLVSQKPATLGFESSVFERWHSIQLKEIPENIENRILLIEGMNKKEAISKNGTKISSYTGKIIEKHESPLMDIENEKICIGVYRHNPVTISELIVKMRESEKEKNRILSWAAYVTDEWEPGNNEFLLKQKKLVETMMKMVS